MARGRAATIFAIALLAAARLGSAAGVKAQAEEAASLNEAARHDDDIVVANELPLSCESENRSCDHPHQVHGKPSKFDVEFYGDDGTKYQIESTKVEDVTDGPIGAAGPATNSTGPPPSNSTSCRGMMSCIRRDFVNLLDELSRVDTYNVTESVQIVRSAKASAGRSDDRRDYGEPYSNLLDRVHRYARTHVLKIHLNDERSLVGKARTFFGCEFLDRFTIDSFCRACALVRAAVIRLSCLFSILRRDRLPA